MKKNFRTGLFDRFWRKNELYFMILPGLVIIILFAYTPIMGLQIAFKNYNIVAGISKSPWVGFKYFMQFFQDPYFFRLIRNTFLLGFYGILWGTPAAVIFALMINEVKSSIFKRISQTVSYLPYFISTVVVVGMMMEIFSSDGVVSSIVRAIGLAPPVFFSDPNWFRTLYTGSGLWQYVGYASILYLATLASNVDPNLVEASAIDGANRWQRIWNIYLPALVPLISIILIINLGHVMTIGIDKVYLMYNPNTYETADILSTYIYRRGLQTLDFSYAAAVGLVNSVVALIIVTGSNYLSRKLSGERLW